MVLARGKRAGIAAVPMAPPRHRHHCCSCWRCRHCCPCLGTEPQHAACSHFHTRPIILPVPLGLQINLLYTFTKMEFNVLISGQLHAGGGWEARARQAHERNMPRKVPRPCPAQKWTRCGCATLCRTCSRCGGWPQRQGHLCGALWVDSLERACHARAGPQLPSAPLGPLPRGLLQYPDADILTSSDHLTNTVPDEGLEKWPDAASAANIGIMLFRPRAHDLAGVRMGLVCRCACCIVKPAAGSWLLA